ncbi:MAG: hypothetical protein COC22_03965 [Flavobacteriaceae bacterium]|nr:MAG: hypothetical protein COC22_03965 [Flavobacteriaceae bacterium]
MDRYDTYKNSGIEWIGEIPEHWEIVKLRYLIDILSGYSPEQCKPSINGDVEYIKVDNINKDSFDINSSTHFTNNDFVVTKTKTILFPKRGAAIGLNKVGITSNPISFDTNIMGLKIKDNRININYLAHFIKSFSLISIADTSTIPQINNKHIYPFVTPFPNKQEQTAIANYLDQKTTEIDHLITQKETLLKHYAEEKTAIINQAVTKGINPNVKLKDSGVDWLGEIPVGWEVKKLKYVAKISLGKMLTNSDKGNYSKKKYLRAANLKWLKTDVSDVKKMWFSENELKKLKLNKNDLLVSEGGEVGRTCIWNNELEECYIQNSVHKVTLDEQNISQYFLYQFYIYGQKGAFDYMVNRISIAHLTVEKIKVIDFLVPPKQEQTQIANHIKAETNKINTKVSNTKKLITLLKEYKTALISEVVTGKIKVN